jgi:cell division septum initiation protein DivIVA
VSESRGGGGAADSRGHGDRAGSGDSVRVQPAGRSVVFPFEGRQLPKALFGYDRDATDELFEEVFAFVEELWHRRSSLQDERDRLAAEAARRGDVERSLADVLLSARREAHAIREEARRDARRTVKSARRKAAKIAAGAERVAQREAKAIVEGAARERDLILEDVERARAFANETHDDLSTLLQSALKWFERGTQGRKHVDLRPPAR